MASRAKVPARTTATGGKAGRRTPAGPPRGLLNRPTPLQGRPTTRGNRGGAGGTRTRAPASRADLPRHRRFPFPERERGRERSRARQSSTGAVFRAGEDDTSREEALLQRMTQVAAEENPALATLNEVLHGTPQSHMTATWSQHRTQKTRT